MSAHSILKKLGKEIDSGILQKAANFFQDKRFSVMKKECVRDTFTVPDDGIAIKEYIKLLLDELDENDDEYKSNVTKIKRLGLSFGEANTLIFSIQIGMKGFKKATAFLAKKEDGKITVYKCLYKISYEIAASQSEIVRFFKSMFGHDSFSAQQICDIESQIRRSGEDFMKAIVLQGLAKELEQFIEN